MSENQRVKKEPIIPSFALSAITRKPISEDLEMAIVYNMAERELRRSFIGKKKEGISLMVKAYYGIWAYPLDGRWILIDLMNLYSFSLTGVKLPPIEEFIQHLRDARNNREIFKNTLVRHNETFTYSEEKVYTIKGLIEKPLALAITGYIDDVGIVSTPSSNVLTLPLHIDQKSVLKVVYELNKVKGELEDNMALLEEAIQVLDEELSFHMAQIDEEIQGIDDEYRSQKDVTSELINRSVEQLKTKKELELKMVLSRFEDRKEFFISQIGEYSKLLMYLKKDYEVLKNMVETTKSLGREQKYIPLWNKIMRETSAKMGDIETEVEGLKSVIKTLEEDRDRELRSIEDAYSQLIGSKMKLLDDIGIERDFEVKKRREEIKDLSNRAVRLRRQISAIRKRVKESLEQIEELPIQELKGDKSKLLCIPFYLVCYESSEGERRYRAYPPSLLQAASTRPLLKWMPGLFTQLLRPYSGQLKDIVEVKFIDRLKSNPILEGEIYKKGKKFDMVGSYSSKKQMADAIDGLVEQGLIAQRQASTLKKRLEAMPSYQ
ncbi:MAG: hypothetical protein L6N94_05950 [Candidatus Methylarchaceae archaeon HK01M]|nr:hypothetical protein [Candidatus Methylarchaceae archaeon HK01M]